MLTIKVKRERQSVTQGEAIILINDKEIIRFGDKIEMIEEGKKHYGDKIGNWASIKPDSDFINGLLYHPFDNYYHHSEQAKKAIIEADEPQI